MFWSKKYDNLLCIVLTISYSGFYCKQVVLYMATRLSNTNMVLILKLYSNVVKYFLTDSCDCCLYSSFKLRWDRGRSRIHLGIQESPAEKSDMVRLCYLAGHLLDHNLGCMRSATIHPNDSGLHGRCGEKLLFCLKKEHCGDCWTSDRTQISNIWEQLTTLTIQSFK